MDRVLIWDESQNQPVQFDKNGQPDQPGPSGELQSRLEKLNQFKVALVHTAEQAYDTLANLPVSVLVLNLTGEHLEKLELIGYMTRHHWATPCIVMIDNHVQNIVEERQQTILKLLTNPVDFKVLVSAIISALYLKDEGRAHSGMSLVNFLLLLQLANQTCRLEIRAPGGLKGYFYFRQGELLDAQNKNLSGNKAVSELLKWDKIMVYFRDLPERRTRKRFKKDLSEIIEQQLSDSCNSA